MCGRFFGLSSLHGLRPGWFLESQRISLDGSIGLARYGLRPRLRYPQCPPVLAWRTSNGRLRRADCARTHNRMMPSRGCVAGSLPRSRACRRLRSFSVMIGSLVRRCVDLDHCRQGARHLSNLPDQRKGRCHDQADPGQSGSRP